MQDEAAAGQPPWSADARRARQAAHTDVRTLRNVALIGGTNVGKTALWERLTGAQPPVAGPTTTLRHATVDVDGVAVALLDTPGLPDFATWVTAGLRAGDAAVFVVAAGRGIPPMTEKLWARCADAGIARVIVVTHLDLPGADYDDTVALCERLFGDVLVTNIPVYDGGPKRPGAPIGVIDVLTQTIFDYSSGTSTARTPDPEHVELVRETRDEFVETVAAASHDETLLDRYLDGEQVADADIATDLRRALAAGVLHPIVAAVPTSGVGCTELLRLIVDAFPSPLERTPPLVVTNGDAPSLPLSCAADGILAAEIVARLDNGNALVRVYSGALHDGASIDAYGYGIGSASFPDGAENAVAGELREVAGLDRVGVGRTMGESFARIQLEGWELPAFPLVVGLQPPAFGEEAAVFSDALLRLQLDDPGVYVDRAAPSIACVGPRHATYSLAALSDYLGHRIATDDPAVGPGRALQLLDLAIDVPASQTGTVLRLLATVRGTRQAPDDSDGSTTRIRVTVPATARVAFIVNVLDATDGTAEITVGSHHPLPPPPDTDIVPGVPH